MKMAHALIMWRKYNKDGDRPEILPDASYQTLIGLERRGLVEHISRDGWGSRMPGPWRAEVTEEGRKLAEELWTKEMALRDRNPELYEKGTAMQFDVPTKDQR